MARKVKNTMRQPLDIEIQGKGENLNLGPRGISRDLSDYEYKSPQLQANLNKGNLVDYNPPEPKTSKKEANK